MPADNQSVTVDPSVVGRNISAARRARGLTQQAVADAFGWTRTTVTGIEKGIRPLRHDEARDLAALLNIELVTLYENQSQPKFRPLSMFLRSSMVPDEGDQCFSNDVNTLQQFCQWYLELEGMTDTVMEVKWPPEISVSEAYVEQQAESAAYSERLRLGIGGGGVDNIYSLLEKQGLRIFSYIFESAAVAGMFVCHQQFGACVALNRRHPAARRRWSLAHEYAHFLADRAKADVSLYFDRRRAKSTAERFADRFAAHFLLPAQSLGADFDRIALESGGVVTPTEVFQLALQYQVSFEAMFLRLEEIARLPSGTWQRLQANGFKASQASRLLHGSVVDRDPHLPLRYQLLVARALQAGHISLARAAAMLDIDEDEAGGLLSEISGITVMNDSDWIQRPMNMDYQIVAPGFR